MRAVPSSLSLVSLLLVTSLFAGCLAGLDGPVDGSESAAERPAASIRCFPSAANGSCDLAMTTDEGRSGNEVTIAVDPTDPNNIVGGAKDFYAPDAGECSWVGVYVSHDGGATFADRSIEGSPRRLLDGDPSDFEPNHASQFWCTTDPVVAFGPDGTLYYHFLAYQADPVTASKLGEGVIPRHSFIGGAVNDWAINRGAMVVAVSHDGGDTFDAFTPVYEGWFPVVFPDKGWLEVGPTGTIHLIWLAIFVPGNQYCRSTDGGMTYDCTEIIAPQFIQGGQGSYVTVGTAGQVYAFWVNNGNIMMKRSFDDGETWGDVETAHPMHVQAMPGLSPRDHRAGYPMFATDRNPDSPFADALYAVWSDACQGPVWSADCTQGNSSIYVAASFDEGETWEDPVRVNDDVAPGGNLSDENWQIFPAVSVSPGGVIDVSWMDTRGTRTLVAEDGSPYPALDQYHAYSLDGGKTWSTNTRVRDIDDGGWDPALSLHQNGMVFIGDYNDIDSSWGAAHPIWPDTREGHADVYSAVSERPLFAAGWTEEDMGRLRASLVADGLLRDDHPYLEPTGAEPAGHDKP